LLRASAAVSPGTLSLHDALPIFARSGADIRLGRGGARPVPAAARRQRARARSRARVPRARAARGRRRSAAGLLPVGLARPETAKPAPVRTLASRRAQ